jgi:hypothetical protein
MCLSPPWSTSSSCGSDDLRAGRRPLRAIGVALAVAVLLIARDAAAAPTATTKPLLLVTLRDAQGERDVEAHDLRFVYFKVTYRQTRAPREEIAGGQRTEVIADREECQCIRLPDWSKIKMKRIRAIEITHGPSDRVAIVRVTRGDGHVNEYRATALYGGDGLYPPFFSATIDGAHREFPLILEGNAGAAWPEESLVRIFRTTKPPPPKNKRPAH